MREHGTNDMYEEWKKSRMPQKYIGLFSARLKSSQSVFYANLQVMLLCGTHSLIRFDKVAG